jgi:uncharacterized membrane protein
MKLSKSELLILIIPVIVAILLIPVLPDKIPMQFDLYGNVNWYLDKKFSFVIGLLPFVIYKSYRKKHRNK